MSCSKMSSHQPDGNVQEEKAKTFDGDLTCLELGKAIKADLEEGHIYSIIGESDSLRKKHCPPSFTPPPSPPPRIAKTQQGKPKTKQSEVSEQHCPKTSGSVKMSHEGNMDEKKVEPTQLKPIFPDDESHVAVAKLSKDKTKDTTTFEKNKKLKNKLSSPSSNDIFKRKYQIQDDVEEKEKTEADTNNKVLDYIGSIKDDIELQGQIYYMPMSSISKDIAENVTTFIRSGSIKVDIKCNDNLKCDSGKDEKEIDDNEYEIMGNAVTKKMGVMGNAVTEKMGVMENAVTEKMGVMGNVVTEKMAVMGNAVTEKMAVMGNAVTEKMVVMGNVVTEKMAVMGNAVTEKMAVMGNDVTEKVDVISPTLRRKGKTVYYRSLSKRELVKYLGKCGLHNLAGVCEKEKLDGHFLEKYINDEDLMLEPFFLTKFQIIKLRAVLNGWRPISEFPTDMTGVSD
ncbi:hypothetical protein ACJMK2_041730 [Sinanodonta woodiana]|uniref:SAM domain-containing protein n=1 Tax=Sinanodonta woodiana TaxID=1069815 RepID=A0ABD3W532_SINWO